MARSRSPVWVGNGQFRNVKGVAATMKKFAALPPQLVAAIKPELERGADDLVAEIKRIAPVSELEATAGALRDSVHREAGDHELSVRVVEDAVDEKGHAIPKHVESGHKAADGSHVAAKPHFWVAYRVFRKKFRSRIGRALTKAVKAIAAIGGKGDVE